MSHECIALAVFTRSPLGERSRIAMSVSVRLSLRVHIARTTRPSFTNFYAITYGGGSVLLWLHCDMLCVSGFKEDIIFAHSG